MRLDKFLKNSRVIKRRTLAKEACDAGRITVNGRVAKASTEVNTGDILEISFGTGILKIEALELIDGAKKGDTENMYKILEN